MLKKIDDFLYINTEKISKITVESEYNDDDPENTFWIFKVYIYLGNSKEEVESYFAVEEDSSRVQLQAIKYAKQLIRELNDAEEV